MDGFTPLNLFGDKKVEEKEIISSEEIIFEKCTEDSDEVVLEKVRTEEMPKECPEEIIGHDSDAKGENEEILVTVDESVKGHKEDNIAQEADKINEVLISQQQILERIEYLSKLFDSRIMYTTHEEKVIDQMHKELQKYKEDMYAQLVRPILLDVIDVRDSIMRMAASYLAKPEGEQNIPNKTFADYAFDLQDILEKNNVEIYRSKEGDSFEPTRQRIIKRVTTQDESMHGIVAESLSSGYSYNGRTISAEKIAVYFFEKKQEENKKSEVD